MHIAYEERMHTDSVSYGKFKIHNKTQGRVKYVYHKGTTLNCLGKVVNRWSHGIKYTLKIEHNCLETWEVVIFLLFNWCLRCAKGTKSKHTADIKLFLETINIKVKQYIWWKKNKKSVILLAKRLAKGPYEQVVPEYYNIF